jgi:branched-subunit amino acid transport protein
VSYRFIQSFLYYIPYAVLAAMTIPAIFTSTGNIYSALAGLAVALVVAFFEKGLVTVALSACGAVLVVEMLQKMIF